MIVTASSDFHGYLPNPGSLPHSDLFAIAGDISPLDCQSDPIRLEEWFKTIFCDWAEEVPTEKIALVAGNHDICFTEDGFPEKLIRILMERDLEGKVTYLENESMTFNGMRIFGCPYSDIHGWAFSTSPSMHGFKADPDAYSKIESDVDLLIVHQAPDFEGLGTSLQTSKHNFGSQTLLKAILDRHPRHVVCGHIHSGNHNPVTIDSIIMRNVSRLDERYIPTNDPTTFAI